jgi:GxxExxY protein
VFLDVQQGGYALAEILFREKSYKIMGAMFEVYKELGCGFLEPVYQECIELELGDQKVPFVAQVQLKLKYKHHPLRSKYIPDAICCDKIVLELKAVKQITDEHRAQVHNYLKATGYRLGIIVNFGHYPKLEYERIVR